MKITKRDWIFIGIVLSVLLFFFSISSEEKTKTVPSDAKHQQVYDIAYKNAPAADASMFKRMFYKPDKKGAEQLCEPCHQSNNVPYPPNHPPKNRCLFCHKLKQR